MERWEEANTLPQEQGHALSCLPMDKVVRMVFEPILQAEANPITGKRDRLVNMTNSSHPETKVGKPAMLLPETSVLGHLIVLDRKFAQLLETLDKHLQQFTGSQELAVNHKKDLGSGDLL